MHGIVDNVGGTILVQSETGKGTVFQVLLPRFEGDAADHARPASVAEKGRGRILYVDDEEGIRTFIGEALEMEGHDVTLAEDGQVAAEILEGQTFHLMITDLKMPRMDGMSLLRKVRAQTPEMEVLVLTAHGTVESAVEALKLGAFDYLSKPLSGPVELRPIAGRALERRRLKEDRLGRVRGAGERAVRDSALPGEGRARRAAARDESGPGQTARLVRRGVRRGEGAARGS